MTVLRLLLLGCLAAAAVPFSQAQTGTESGTSTSNSSAGGWLSKEDPRAVAWQAYDAILTHDEDSIPKLLSLASQWQPLSVDGSLRLSASQEDERDAMTEVLDALIQLNAFVPADTLRNLAPDFDNAVSVLLVRMPVEESRPLSLEFFRSPPKPDYSVQYVSAAVLALHPSSEFARQLLGSIRVWARVVVIRPGVGYGYSSSTGSCVSSSEPDRDDWPLIGHYKLSLARDE